MFIHSVSRQVRDCAYHPVDIVNADWLYIGCEECPVSSDHTLTVPNPPRSQGQGYIEGWGHGYRDGDRNQGAGGGWVGNNTNRGIHTRYRYGWG